MVLPDRKFGDANTYSDKLKRTVLDVKLFNNTELLSEPATFSRNKDEPAKREEFFLPPAK